MHKLIYASRRKGAAPDALERLLAASRENNRRDGITGALLYDGRRFLQLLEGEHDALARCFLRIVRHPLHREIEIGVFLESAARLFARWEMRAMDVGRAEPSLSIVWRRAMAMPEEPARLALIERQMLDWFSP